MGSIHEAGLYTLYNKNNNFIIRALRLKFVQKYERRKNNPRLR